MLLVNFKNITGYLTVRFRVKVKNKLTEKVVVNFCRGEERSQKLLKTVRRQNNEDEL